MRPHQTDPKKFMGRNLGFSLIALALYVIARFAGTLYFMDQVSRYNQIGYYASTQALFAGKIALGAKRLSEAEKKQDTPQARMLHAALDDAISSFEANHLTLTVLQHRRGIGPRGSNSSALPQQHEVLIKAYTESARLFLRSAHTIKIPDGLDPWPVITLSQEILTAAEQLGRQSETALRLFDSISMAILLIGLIVIWFAMARPSFVHAHGLMRSARLVEQRLRDIEKASGDAIHILDRSMRVIMANETACAMAAQTPDQMIGATITSLYAGPVYWEIIAAYRAVLDNTKSKTFRKYVDLPNGSSDWFEFHINPCTDGILIVVRNVTEQKELEDVLRTGEERATAMLQFSTDAVIAFDERGSIESFNLSAESVFGYESGKILGRPIKNLMSDNSPFAENRHINDFNSRELAALSAGISMEGRRRNGELFPTRTVVNEIWNKDRRIFVATIHDLTDEVAAQTRLREAVERFDLCVRGSDSAIWDIDLGSGNLFLAPRFKQLLGYGEEDNFNTLDDLFKLMHPDDAATLRGKVTPGPDDGERELNATFRLLARNGEYLWFQSKGALRRDQTGAAVRMAGSMTEITARVNAETELRRHRDHLVKMVDAQTRHIKKSEARLATAVNGVSEGMCVTDENNLIVLVNRHMKDMYPEVAEILHPGVALDDVFEEILEKNELDEERRSVYAEHFERMRSGSASSELRQPNGGWIRITRAKTPDGGRIILHTDITQYKEQEARLQAQARELENALGKEKEINTLHKQFVSMASHEFRTPLAIIDGSAQILGREIERMTPDRVRSRAEKIRGAVSRMTKLIESTLTVARLDAGKVDITVNACNLRELITDIMGRQQELSATHRITCDLAGLPDKVLADSKAIDQVMTNLLSNSVKYSPNHPDIHIRGSLEGAFAVVSVRDFGLGIAEADLPQIFSRFFRAQNSTGIVGTGIGLNLVKELVTMHGGNVRVDSRAGEGSTFTVYLPVNGPQSQAA